MSIFRAERLAVGFERYDGLIAQSVIPALGALGFEIGRGEVLALVGASGAGKSLLAHAIFGILPPNAIVSGRMMLGSTVLDGRTRPGLSGRHMALVPQSISHLDPLVRCGRQLEWGARRSGRKADAKHIARTLARFGLDDGAARLFPHQLSGGMARRMLLAIATVGHPDLIVADEPTSGLDAANAAAVLSHLRALANAGNGVLLITHSLADAMPFADRVALIDNGRMTGIERAEAFSGDGHLLVSPYAKALWSALPGNAFFNADQAHA